MSRSTRRALATLLIVLTPLPMVAQGPASSRAGLSSFPRVQHDVRPLDVDALRARADSGETWSTEVGLGLGIVGGLAVLIAGNGASESSGRNNSLGPALLVGAVLGATGALIGFFFPKK
jgi:F0F1-type ATP synthase membrane subunit c/vacuolar-type H+-ATPase subunit K